MSKNRKRKPIVHAELDIALLTCGLVDIEIYKKCVNSIVEYSKGINCNFYVYVNGAPKETVSDFLSIANSIPNVKVKQTGERVGFPAGANRVIKMGSSPFFMFITDDIVLKPGAIQSLIETMNRDDKISLCGMKLLFPEDSQDQARPAGRVQHIGHAIDIRGEVTHPLIGWKPDNPKCCNSREVLSVTGGVFIARRQAFNQVRGFYEGYGLGYFEDIDLNLSLREAGWKIWIDANAVADHYTNQSMMKADQPVPMNENKMLFRARKQHLLVNDSFTFW